MKNIARLDQSDGSPGHFDATPVVAMSRSESASTFVLITSQTLPLPKSLQLSFEVQLA